MKHIKMNIEGYRKLPAVSITLATWQFLQFMNTVYGINTTAQSNIIDFLNNISDSTIIAPPQNFKFFISVDDIKVTFELMP